MKISAYIVVVDEQEVEVCETLDEAKTAALKHADRASKSLRILNHSAPAPSVVWELDRGTRLWGLVKNYKAT